jgi:hypothetical protein
MNPIAVVHWVDGKGRENMRPCFTQKSLDRVTGEIRDRNFMSWTCMCRGDAAIPLRPPKRHVRAI